MNRTIKKRVEELLHESIKLEYVWHHIQAEFPHNSASWGYIKRIERDWMKSQKLIPPMENPPEEGTPAGATSSPTAPAPDPARFSPAATRDAAQDADFGDDK